MKMVLAIITCLFTGLHCLSQGTASLTIYAPVLSPHDTLELYIWNDIVSSKSKNTHRVYKASNAEGFFCFKVDSIGDRSWISLNLSFQKLGRRPIHNILEDFMMETGDDVLMYLSPRLGRVRSLPDGYDGNIPVLYENWAARFEGKGAVKYRASWHIAAVALWENQSKMLGTIENIVANRSIALQYALQEGALEVLKRFERELKTDIYVVLEGQVRGKYGMNIGRILEKMRFFSRNEQEKATAQKELDKYLHLLHENTTDYNIFTGSPYYIEHLVQYYWLAFTEQSGGKGGVGSWYRYCKEKIKPSVLRDRVLTSLLMNRFQEAPHKETLEDALINIDDPYCQGLLEPLKHHLSGNEVFDFVLPDANGKYYSLKDFRGKVVFMDFWYAACIPCRQYMTEVVSPVKQQYKDNPDVVFLTVSTDRLDTFRKMIERDNFLPKDGIHLYTDNLQFGHPIIEYYQIGAYPFPMLIGRDGRLMKGVDSLQDVDKLSEAIQGAL